MTNQRYACTCNRPVCDTCQARAVGGDTPGANPAKCAVGVSQNNDKPHPLNEPGRVVKADKPRYAHPWPFMSKSPPTFYSRDGGFTCKYCGEQLEAHQNENLTCPHP
jgi:hypothetical protein